MSICSESSVQTALERERVRFFSGQFITADDLRQAQDYARYRLRNHNRTLHGCGVICGCRVRPGTEPFQVIVEPGRLIDGFGDEVAIERELTIDLRRQDLNGNASSCDESMDPWCSDVQVPRRAGERLFLAVRYAECLARPIRADAQSCGCSESRCEYSRIRDSYEMRVMTEMPEAQPRRSGLALDPWPACPAQPAEAWVALASITPGAGGAITPQSIEPVMPRVVAHMAGTHGSAVQVENPAATTAVVRFGFFTLVAAAANSNNWFHYAIPTPLMVDGNRLRASRVLLRFNTSTADVAVRSVHIYDGEIRIGTHDNLNLSGTQLQQAFPVPNTPELNWGIGISIGVQARNAGEIRFIAASTELVF